MDKYNFYYYLYRHIRPDTNQVFYIGLGSKRDDKSEYYRAYSKQNRSIHWKRIVKKLEQNYRVDIIFESNDYNLIIQKEIEFIALYGRSDTNCGTLCNKNNGGVGFLSHHTEETKRKQSTTLKNKYSSGEVISATKGKKLNLTEEQRLRRKLMNKGRKHTEEEIDKIKEFQKNRIWTEENIEIARKNIKKAHEVSKKPIIQMSLNGEFIREWESGTSVENQIGIKSCNISLVCCGKSISAGGFKWKFKTSKDKKPPKVENPLFGERVNSSVLSSNDVILIRKEYTENKTKQKILAKKYGVKQVTISAIVTNKTWKHLL